MNRHYHKTKYLSIFKNHMTTRRQGSILKMNSLEMDKLSELITKINFKRSTNSIGFC